MQTSHLLSLLAGTLLPAILISVSMCYLLRKCAQKFSWIDEPGGHKSHTSAVPLGGGWGIWTAMLIPLLLALLLCWQVERFADILPALMKSHAAGVISKADEVLIFLVGGTLLATLGFVDDLRRIPWQIRLSLQFLIVATVVGLTGWQVTIFWDMPQLTFILTVFWGVALINSFNMLDNMDGLSAGSGLIIALILATSLLSGPFPEQQQPQLFVGALLLLLAGGLIGFLCHNYYPARLYMGDAGSYVIGYTIAICSVLATYTSADLPRMHAVLTPLCLLALPLYDMLTVLWIRWREGDSLFAGDQRHFSHRLVELGFSPLQAVWIIYLLTAACGLGAFLLRYVPGMGAMIIFLQISAILLAVSLLESRARVRNENR